MQVSKAQQAELEFLRRRVDTAQEAALKNNKHLNVQQDLWRAREELERFVTGLRKEGYDI